MNDSSLSNIRQEVTYKFKRNESGFDFTDVRFDKIAEGFGIPAARISKLDELEAQLRSEPDEFPRLYDIVIDRAPSVWTDMV
jgi:thiamine pyrophosphate-dependent acetolactate synthase large subunit-like protein